jgi:hypothetical protein
LEGLGECHTIDRSHLSADRYARRGTTDGNSQGLQAPGDKKGRSLTFDRRIGGEDDLPDILRPAPTFETIDGEIVGAHPVKWRQMAEKGVVEPWILAGGFDRPGGCRFLDHQDDAAIATRVGTHRAGIVFGQEAAGRAQPNRFAQPRKKTRERLELTGIAGQKVFGKTLRGPRPDPGQSLEVREQSPHNRWP